MSGSSIFKTYGYALSATGGGGSIPTTNLYRWFDASDSATLLNIGGSQASNGEGIYTWIDKSGNNSNLTNQYGQAPVLVNGVLNNRPILRFTANGQFNGSQLRGIQNLGNGSLTFFVVYQWRDLHRTYSIDVLFTLGSEFGSGGEGGIGTASPNEQFSLHGNTFVAGAIPLNQFRYISLVYNSSNLQQKGFLNGTQVGSTQTGNSNAIDNQLILGSWVYNSGNSPEYFADADIAEVIIYNSALSDTDRQQVENYLNYKYNLNGGGTGGGGGGTSFLLSTPARILIKGYTPPTPSTPDIITSGLTNWLDISNPQSYPSSGTIINDLSTYQRNATLVNGASYSSDSGGSINLNGSNQYIVTSNLNNAGQYTTNNTSFFIWVYPTAAGQIVSELGNGVPSTSWHDSQIEMHTDGTIHFSIWHNNPSYPQRVVSQSKAFNQWYLLGLTYDGTTLTAYINGEVIGTTNVSRNSPYYNGFGLYYGLGSADTTNMGIYQYLNGNIGAFYSYNKSLTPSEVLQNYDATKSRYTGGGTTSNTLLNGIQAYWTLNETSGSRKDSVNSFDMSDINNVTYDTGILGGNSASFDGSNFLNYNNQIVPASSEISFSGWAYYSRLDGNQRLYDDNGVYGIQIGTGPIEQILACAVNGSNGPAWYYSSYIIPINTWFHCVVTFDNSFNLKFYVNGDLITTTNTGANNGPWFPNNCTPTLGADSRKNTGFILGKIDEVGIWNRALTQQEVTQLYANGNGISYPFAEPVYVPPKFKIITKGYIKPPEPQNTIVTDGLILLLDATDPSSYPGTGGTWLDISGNNNNFNINPAAWNPTGYMDFKGSYGCAKNYSDIALSGDVTYLCVTRMRNSTNDWRTLTRSYVADHQVIAQNGGWDIGMYDNDASGFISSGYSQQSLPGYASNSFDVMCWRWTNNDNPTYALNVDGTDVASITNSNARYNRGFGSIGAYHLANTNPFSADQFWGDIKFFAVYNRRLTDQEVLQNYNAMVAKFGL